MDRNLIISNIFRDSCNNHSNKTAVQVVNDDFSITKYTFKDIEENALKIAAFLCSESDKLNSKFVAVILENRPEWIMIYFGIMCAGLTAVPIDPQLTSEEIDNLLHDCGAQIAFISKNCNLNKTPKKTVLVGKEEDGSSQLTFKKIKERFKKDPFKIPDIHPDRIASLIYTSGTTGKPKGVCLTHSNLLSNFKSIQKLNICTSEDNMISILPLYHTYSFMITLLLPFFIGASITYPPTLRSEDIIKTINICNVTILTGVPQLFYLIHKTIFDRLKKLPSFLSIFFIPLIKLKVRNKFGNTLRLMVSGGARLEPKIGRDLKSLGFQFIEGYGLTETSPVVTFTPPKKPKFGSVGKPLPDVEIKINEPDSSGIGEILVKGPNVMNGYFNKPEITKEAIKEGWFYTGDLGYTDDEGYLHLTGRKKDVIVLSSGKNIYPEEIEEYYGQIPYIKEICVFAQKQFKFGQEAEVLHAVIAPDPEYFRKKGKIDIEGTLRWELENYSRRISPYKHIMGFTITNEDLPRTRLKKIKRFEVKEKYKNSISVKQTPFIEPDQDRKLLNSSIAKKVVDYLSKTLKRKINIYDHLELDLGIDSLGRVELAVGLEASIGIDIPDKSILGVFTVKELINEINNISEKGILTKDKHESISWKTILKDQPNKKALSKIELLPGLFNKITTFLVQIFLFIVFRLFYSIKIEGKENIPDSGPFIICPNHASYLDGFIVGCSVPFDTCFNLFFFGDPYYFDRTVIRRIARFGRIIPIAPSTNLIDSMQSASFLVKNGKSLCIFPEGELSIDGTIKSFKKGIGILAKELNVPLIPVYIDGSFKAWARGMKLPKLSKINIKFGKCVTFGELAASLEEDEYQNVASNLKKKVLELQL
ncbi:MAG: AMP-binding protein [Endomicrobiales bacterium]|nr:AMP-binding protein [Endomicrobiales bacterium]